MLAEDTVELEALKENLKSMKLQNEMLWKVIQEKNLDSSLDSNDHPEQQQSTNKVIHDKSSSCSGSPTNAAKLNLRNEKIHSLGDLSGIPLPKVSALCAPGPVINGPIKVTLTKCKLDFDEKSNEMSWFTFNIKPSDHEGWYIEKQIFDLVLLDAKLRKDYSKVLTQSIGKFPDKKVLSSHSPVIRDIRRKALESYLQQVIDNITESAYLQRFITTGLIDEKDACPFPFEVNTAHGYLTKKGKHLGSWMTRYYRIKNGKLEYFSTASSAMLGIIHLSNISVAPLNYEIHGISSGDEFRHGFVIDNLIDKKRHILCAENDHERDEWIKVLQSDFSNQLDYAYEDQNFFLRSAPGSFSRSRIRSESQASSASSLMAAEITRKRRTLFDSEWITCHQDEQEEGSLAIPVFGRPLQEAYAEAKEKYNYETPCVVHRCIEFLEQEDVMKEEGLYRVSGSMLTINQLKAKFDSKGDVDLKAEKHDAHAIAGLLKLYIRELPDSLLGGNTINTIPTTSFEQVQVALDIIRNISTGNFLLLKALIKHLMKLVQYSKYNKMTMKNVGIIFSATLRIPAWLLLVLMNEFDTLFAVEPFE